jgi:PmbA protein
VAREARERALARLGSKKIESAKLAMIVEPRAAGRLVRALMQPLAGDALQQKQSFLDGQIGKRVASHLLTMVDEPLLPKGLGSRPYDGDGFASRRLPIIEAGVLRAFLVDDYYGRKLKMPPTTGDTSNLVFSSGDKGLDALATDAKEAIVVTSFLGGNSNSTTGDYSLGVSGYRVRKGKRAEPVIEMNVAGNQRELWQRLVALGNDPYPYSSMRTPTLVFDHVTFAGA